MVNICSVEGCNNKVVAKGLCSKHYTQIRRYGKIFKYSHKTNHIELFKDHAEIYLIDCNNEICAIDLEDVDKKHRSDLQRNTFYCISTWRRLHRLDPKILVDHNGLDER